MSHWSSACQQGSQLVRRLPIHLRQTYDSLTTPLTHSRWRRPSLRYKSCTLEVDATACGAASTKGLIGSFLRAGYIGRSKLQTTIKSARDATGTGTCNYPFNLERGEKRPGVIQLTLYLLLNTKWLPFTMPTQPLTILTLAIVPVIFGNSQSLISWFADTLQVSFIFVRDAISTCVVTVVFVA